MGHALACGGSLLVAVLLCLLIDACFCFGLLVCASSFVPCLF